MVFLPLNGYYQSMKLLIKILILLDFAAVVFIPSIYMSRLTLIPMFAGMVALVVLYWFVMYWVSKKRATQVLGETPKFDIFVGKIPTDPNADLTRGRLCIHGNTISLLQKTDGKESKDAPYKVVWSMDASAITSIGFGKVLSVRKGFILYMDKDDVRFTCCSIAKHKDELYAALGWKFDSVTAPTVEQTAPIAPTASVEEESK